MKKPLKVLSAGALATVFAASALTPVAAATVEDNKVDQYVLQDVVFHDGDKLAKIPFSLYTKELAFKTIDDQVAYVMYPNGEMYDLALYTKELAFNNNDAKATYEALKDNAIEEEVYEGYIDDKGKVRAKADEQPEDRLNETFFYNAA